MEAWRLTCRKALLFSAAKMMARQESRFRFAAAVYFWARRRELANDERPEVERKLKEARIATHPSAIPLDFRWASCTIDLCAGPGTAY